ncbi:transposase [Chryseobacterium sp. G0162]|uniref:transposase n=1 Tax=Chryseobacterium sp. G0162 TaxID=2487063 RepID=UPI000F513AB5|nr:transposase [Chryseobacterium sp. G0162]AZB07656.1 transposase [Chryseobacterium sp. G0162]
MIFKDIHIGSCIEQKIKEDDVEMDRLTKFFNRSEEKIQEMLVQDELPTGTLLMWSKILEYDFFRIYSQHLILYAPQKRQEDEIRKNNKSSALPKFRKNIYTKEIIDFIIDLINSGQKTKQQLIDEYRIPKTTLYKWLDKYNDK